MSKVLMSIDLEKTPGEKIHGDYDKVRQLASAMGWTLNPIYVESSKEFCCSNKELLEQRRKELKIKMLETVRDWNDQGLKDGTVVLGCPTQVRSKTELLSRYAQDIESPLIIVFGKGHVGYSRFLMGSFTQELINESHVPILAINSDADIVKGVKKILFATDFHDCAQGAYEKLLDFASKAKAQVVLLHHEPQHEKHKVDFNKVTAEPKWNVTESRGDSDEISTETVNEWMDLAKKHGVEIDFVLQKRDQKVSDSIVAASREYGCDMIAMGSRSNSLNAAEGSVSKKILEEAHVPVWVLKC